MPTSGRDGRGRMGRGIAELARPGSAEPTVPGPGSTPLARAAAGRIGMLATLAHLVAFVAMLPVVAGFESRDLTIYRDYGQRLWAGAVPYRDFVVEYPPLALALLWLPATLTTDLPAYRALFALQLVVCDLLWLAAALWWWRRAAPTAIPWGLLVAQPFWLVLAGRAIAVERFDLAAATVAALAVLLLAGGRPRWAWVALGAGVALKLYPAVLAPLFLLWLWRRRRPRQLALDLVACAGVPILATVAATRGQVGAIAVFFRYHLERGVEIESLYALPPLLARQFGAPLARVTGHGAVEVVAASTPALGALALPLTVVALAGLYLVAWRSWVAAPVALAAPTADALFRLSAAALVIFIADGKVLSPQYLLWLYPLLPLLAGRRVALWAAFGLALLLGQWVFPFHWFDLLAFVPGPVLALAARDALLLALLPLLLVPARRPAGSR